MGVDCRVGLTLRDHLVPVIGRARDRGLIDCVEANISPYIATASLGLLRSEIAAVELPYSFHLTDSSVCSADFPSNEGCADAARFIANFSPLLISDHFTACRIADLDLDMNLPIFASEEAIAVYAENVEIWRSTLATTGVETALEHVPGGFDFAASTRAQSWVYRRVMEATGSGILLDLHNAYCDEISFGEPAERFIESLPLDAVVEIHLAGGHCLAEGTYVDGHSRDLPARVLELLSFALERTRPKLVILEREHDFMGFDNMLRDLEQVRERIARC